jgi:N-acetylglutamate synthase-like GNAT family acetyltransferase
LDRHASMRAAEAGPIIRPFRPIDQTSARELILRGLGEHFGFIDTTMNPDLRDIQTYYISQGHHFLVALQSNEVVGTGALMYVTQEMGQLVRISVDPRQRRDGLGSRIVERLLDLARHRGLRRVELETNKSWIEVVHFYSKLGFIVIREDVEQVYMRRSL